MSEQKQNQTSNVSATPALSFEMVSAQEAQGQKLRADMIGLEVSQEGNNVVFEYRLSLPVSAFANRNELNKYVVIPKNSKGGRGYIGVNPETLQGRQVRIGDATMQFSPTMTTGISVRPK